MQKKTSVKLYTPVDIRLGAQQLQLELLGCILKIKILFLLLIELLLELYAFTMLDVESLVN